MPETIGERIKHLRESHDMTRIALARLMHVDRRTVSRWEDGSAALRHTDIERLSEIFRISCDYIVTGKIK